MTNMRNGLRALFAMAIIGAALAIPAQSAFAQSCANGNPTNAQYCEVQGVNTGGNTPGSTGPTKSNNGGNLPDSNSGNGPSVDAADASGETPQPTTAAVTPVQSNAVESSGSSLPFTGLDVGILLLVAAGLGIAGFVLRRLTAVGEPRS